MMYYSVMTQAYSEKEIPSSPNDLPITSSDALPLSYRRLASYRRATGATRELQETRGS